MIQIDNDGAAIRSTNYWKTMPARQGIFFLSWCQRTARLLLPSGQTPALMEMQTADYVIITRGTWTQARDRIGWELMFEDHSTSPYAVHLLAEEHSDHKVIPRDVGRYASFTVWTEDEGLVLELPARIRSAKRLPYLKSWKQE